SNGAVVGRLARTADVAGTPEQTGNGRINLARAILDPDVSEIKPSGAAPVGNGGPFIGPYVIASTPSLEQFANIAAPGVWQGTLNSGDATFTEGDMVPLRYVLSGLSASTSYTVALKVDLLHGSTYFADWLGSIPATSNGLTVTAAAGTPYTGVS